MVNQIYSELTEKLFNLHLLHICCTVKYKSIFIIFSLDDCIEKRRGLCLLRQIFTNIFCSAIKKQNHALLYLFI